MSNNKKKANPAVIGSFVTGAIVLVVAGVMVFSSGKLFTHTFTLVTVFPDTVKGLQVGNAVVFRGVRIGSVKEIKILYDKSVASVVVPVYLEIVSGTIVGVDLKKLQDPKFENEWKAEIDNVIRAGLRARLEIQSIVTGQMAVSLDFSPDTPAKLTGVDTRYTEIPALPSVLTRLTDMFKKFPLEKITQELNRMLSGVNHLLYSRDMQNMLHNASLAARKAHELISGISDRVQPLSDSAQMMLAETRQAIRSIEKQLNRTLKHIATLSQNVNSKVNPLSKSAISALDEAGTVFKRTEVLVGSADDLIGQDSVTRAELESTLQELAGAARSFRILANYLEQHPNALIRGKGY